MATAGPSPTLIAAGLIGLSGVALGALGAHALSERLAATALETWQTAALYHLLHAPALLAVGLAVDHSSGPQRRWLTRASAAFCLGVLLFSGSLYALALGGPRVLGPVTPLGGLFLMAGWGAVILAGMLRNHDD